MGETQQYELDMHLMRLRARKRRRNTILLCIVWFAGVWLVFYQLFGISAIEGDSMRPAYCSGDVLIYQRFSLKNLKYGDAVIIRTSLGKDVIKRIVGKPGDFIEVDSKGHLTRNGEMIQESEMIFGVSSTENAVTYPFTVPEGEYFYLGDNRPVSLDSRNRELSTAEESDIIGKVVVTFRFHL